MDNTSGISKLAGRLGSLLLTVGVASYFIGIFGGPRALAFAGLAMIVASMVGFFIEEDSSRRATRVR